MGQFHSEKIHRPLRPRFSFLTVKSCWNTSYNLMNGSVTLHNSERNETDSFRKFIPCIKLPFVSSNSFAESVTRVRPIDRVMRNDRTQGIYRLNSLNFCWTTGNRWRTDEATERSEIHSCRSETWLENQTGKKKRKRIVLEEMRKLIIFDSWEFTSIVR